jgi:hypothetical protein
MADDENVIALCTETLILACSMAALMLKLRKQRRKRKQSVWVKKCIGNRDKHGVFITLLPDLEVANKTTTLSLRY